MDSLTAHYLARALDARWRGRRVLAVRADREARTVTVAVEGSPTVRFALARDAPSAVEMEGVPADGARLAGWTVREVAAPLDDRRLRVAFEHAGKFRGSPRRSATLELSFVPTARGARLLGDVTHIRLGARIPAVTEPRPLLAAAALHADALDDAALMRGRWMSPALHAWIRADPPRAGERYAMVAALPPEPPPPVGALFGAAGSSSHDESPAPLDERRARAIARMERELRAAAEAPALRAQAHALRERGDADVADALHARASAMERALASLPARIAAVRDAPAEAPRPREEKARARAPRAARPYREYRSSGGLDIWVGRGAASNDALTFHESAPNDVWLHARDAAGAHVILRWSADEPPPKRDLIEAAALAAWHSKSRGSTVVPVDWTRRKLVRKPRGAPPGSVTVERTKSIAARPSAALERALRKN